MNAYRIGFLLTLLLGLGACNDELAEITPGLTSLRVEFVALDGENMESMIGSSDNRLGERDEYPVRLRVTMLDENGLEMTDRTETVRIKAQPGKLGKNYLYDTAEVASGDAIDVMLKSGYGDVSFWVEAYEIRPTNEDVIEYLKNLPEEEKIERFKGLSEDVLNTIKEILSREKNELFEDLPEDEKKAILEFLNENEKMVVILATGISEAMYLPFPNVKSIQIPVATGSDVSQWNGFNLRLETGDLIVEHVGGEGFWFVDTSLEDYNALFVYTRNSPYLNVGDKLKYITGNVMEFYGTTQFSYSYYEVESEGHALPDPVEITAEMIADKTIMESLESRVVRVSGIRVNNIENDAEILSGYLTYHQYPVSFTGGGAVTLYTKAGAPDFDPREHKGATISFVTGVLKQHYSADPQWIILARDADDIGEITEAENED